MVVKNKLTSWLLELFTHCDYEFRGRKRSGDRCLYGAHSSSTNLESRSRLERSFLYVAWLSQFLQG